ncbi:MAG: MGMT family protein [Vicinamibacteria bacterium]|nr:MGMT family protein [Vicinamibacteria bacterium]
MSLAPDPGEGTPGDIVRSLVRKIPPGRAATYGTVGRVATALGRPIGGARTVAWILASLRGDDQTPWYRVVGAGGILLLKDRRGALQMRRLKDEGVRFVQGVIARPCLIDDVELLSTRRRRLRSGT